MIHKKISILITAAMVALAVFTASAAADTTFTMDIHVTSQDTYVSAPQNIAVPDNATKLIISADTTDNSIDIHLYDPSGRHTGATYPTGEETEISNSTYSGWNSDPETITVDYPAPGDYTLKAYGYYTTGWANVTVTIIEGALPGENAHIKGRVMERLPDGSLKPLKDVDVTATNAVTMTVVGTTATGGDGYFTIDVPPYSVIDLKFTKAGYEDRSEEGIDLTKYGPCEIYDRGTIFMTKRPVIEEYCVNITADPMSSSVCIDEDATYILTVCNCANISDTIVLSVTAGPGSLNKTTFPLDSGECDVTELTVSSPTAGTFDTTVRATSQGNTSVYEEVTVTTTVMGANLRVLVRDYVTGNLVGMFNKTNITAGTECRVPEVWVEVKAITGEVIKGKLTTNGIAEFCISLATYPKVDVFANNRIDEWYMPNVDDPKYYVPWIEPGSESGVSILPIGKTTALIYVGVKEPPIHRLRLDVKDPSDKEIWLNTAEDATAVVTGSYTYDGTSVTKNIPHATITLDGAGVAETNITDSDGIATFSAVTPTILEDITVTATKPPCFVGDTDTIKVRSPGACPVIEVRSVDAEHSDNLISSGAEILLRNANGDIITMPTWILDNSPQDLDPTVGVINIDTTSLNLSLAKDKGPFYLNVKAPGYNGYIEHGIDLSAQLACTDPPAPAKKKTAPMTE